MKGNLACLYFGGTFRGFVGTFLDLVVFFGGLYIYIYHMTLTQTMHYWREIPQTYHTCVLFDTSKMDSLMTPVVKQVPKTGSSRNMAR